MAEIGNELFRKPFRGGYDVDKRRADGALGHRRKFRVRRLLREGDAAFFFYGPKPQTAVGAHAGKDYADAFFLPLIRERSEKKIDRKRNSVFFNDLE